MEVQKLDAMTKGWFVGNFSPSVLKTEDVEVAVKHYLAGDSEPWHVHKIGTEITCIISGEVLMNGKRFKAGDIVVMKPGEGTDFCALTDAINVVVKTPSVAGDKYLAQEV